MDDFENKDDFFQLARNLHGLSHDVNCLNFSNISSNDSLNFSNNSSTASLKCFGVDNLDNHNIDCLKSSNCLETFITNKMENSSKSLVVDDENPLLIDWKSSLSASVGSDNLKSLSSIESSDLYVEKDLSDYLCEEVKFCPEKTSSSHKKKLKIFTPEFEVASFEDSRMHEIDLEACKTWEFPTDYEKRDYQYDIIEKALFKNTLVCLPTGMGKTFIAAIIAYNYHRWFPHSKIIFMAPTKPLVLQQYEACKAFMKDSNDEMTNLTGTICANNRAKLWKFKHLFFVTPQIPKNDIESGICPAKEICLLIVDEAHRASGNYPYCQVVKNIAKQNRNFRILALTATPGNNKASIQRIMKSLLISHLEVKTECNPDVIPHIHKKHIENIILDLSAEIICIRQLFLTIINIPLKWLQENHFLYRNKTDGIISFTAIETAYRKFQKRTDIPFPIRIQAQSNFATSKIFYHGYKLLNDYGLYAFSDWLEKQIKRSKEESIPDIYYKLIQSKEWNTLLKEINSMKPLPEHPKLVKLKSLVKNHFENCPHSSRVIIFAQFRIAVEEILRALSNDPVIRPISFIGQSKNGLSQKKQLDIIHQFRNNVYNTFISTCIGEEGLDIGEVDLIICFDSQISSIRTIQRMGRTGRKRDGKCIMLFIAGLDDNIYQKSEIKIKKLNTSLDPSKYEYLNYEPLLLPPNLHPKVVFKSFKLNSSKKLSPKRQNESIVSNHYNYQSYTKQSSSTSDQNFEDDPISSFVNEKCKIKNSLDRTVFPQIAVEKNDKSPHYEKSNLSITTNPENNPHQISNINNQPSTPKKSSPCNSNDYSLFSSDITTYFNKNKTPCTSTPQRKSSRPHLIYTPTNNKINKQINVPHTSMSKPISSPTSPKPIQITPSSSTTPINNKIDSFKNLLDDCYFFKNPFTKHTNNESNFVNSISTDPQLPSPSNTKKLDYSIPNNNSQSNTEIISPNINFCEKSKTTENYDCDLLSNTNSCLQFYSKLDSNASKILGCFPMPDSNKFETLNSSIPEPPPDLDLKRFKLGLSKERLNSKDFWSTGNINYFNRFNDDHIPEKISDSNSHDVESVFKNSKNNQKSFHSKLFH